MTVFLSTLNQTAFLFAFIAIGFFLAKTKQIPENSATVLSKLENLLFIPALVGGTFMKDFTVERLSSMWKLLLVSSIILAVVVLLVLLIVKLLSKDKYIQNIYTYGLCFSNFGFMGNAVVSALFPDIFTEYIVFTLPLWILIYLWGVPSLLMSDSQMTIRQKLKNFLNPMFIGMILGMVIGLTKVSLPAWITSVVTVSGSCMSPVAMLLTGITVSQINFKKTFTNVGIYAVSVIRLLVLPLLFVLIARFIPMSETAYICAVCSLSMPLGLNTIVIPAAYGKDTSVPAGMALISHFLSCVTIPLLFMIIG
ncbi:MAG: hypothetical protein E7406_04285 [Ruminococcaceae bacterium]|nr:hypothetical protein [Oscillospiraceae bacterium]